MCDSLRGVTSLHDLGTSPALMPARTHFFKKGIQMKTKSLTAFGTYGFLSLMMAAQIAAATSAVDNADRATVDAKKSARSVKRDMKKAGRKVTGQDNTYDDVKDEVQDAGKNLGDEAAYHNRKIKRKAE